MYGPEALRHPPHLTKPERPRFIRAYYQLWGFMIIPQTGWRAQLESMSLKELYHLCDISKLTQNIGREEEDAPLYWEGPPHTPHHLNFVTSVRREQLSRQSWKCIEKITRDRLGQRPDWPWHHAPTEGYHCFLVMWDHWQDDLKACCGLNRPQDPQDADKCLWVDSSDEEH